MGVSGETPPSLNSQTQALFILNKCSPTVTQFECNGQGWRVSSDTENVVES